MAIIRAEPVGGGVAERREKVDALCLQQPDLLHTALAALFPDGKDTIGQRRAIDLLGERLASPEMARGILYELAGRNYLRAVGFAFLLTSRGRVYLGSQKH